MVDFVKFEVPEKLMTDQLALIAKVKKNGKIRIGINEVTKAIERGSAKLVLIASDVEPAEIVMHLPLICNEKDVPFSYVKTKKDLGEGVGIGVGTASIAIVEEGDAKSDLQELTKKLEDLRK
ncbi:MAG: 50S ribosomal protein L7ae [Candidatus Diapherotrites archaeon]|uniref:Large ribosomal subunit protein eL8 n=1 Tax=Candidatus Iainarchaeum sp. TaxID=3101447 RepID=A0A2D6M0M5_9ARCH|nr:50S ribosomal protein L7ae [Candidatus Diapherotrites archaeon]|tara:strand:- start:4417 stop:4782 length:366 start_codon:yes stop_codon:yes gene_type:complete